MSFEDQYKKAQDDLRLGIIDRQNYKETINRIRKKSAVGAFLHNQEEEILGHMRRINETLKKQRFLIDGTPLELDDNVKKGIIKMYNKVYETYQLLNDSLGIIGVVQKDLRK